MSQPLSVAQAVLSANIGGWADVGVVDVDIVVEACAETEWHEVYFLSCSKGKVVLHFPSWQGAALANRAAASRFVSVVGLAPAFLGCANLSRPSGEVAVGEATEWLSGGHIARDGLEDLAVMERLGVLYGRLHSRGSDWFDSSVPSLQAEGRLPMGGTASDWASCSWILAWLQELVPDANRAALAAQGVDWGFIADEIAALPSCDFLPATAVVTVHGDSHPGNVVLDSTGQMRLIDFDMTARGPAGSEFGYIVMMLFRCGFAPELVLPIEAQRAFARGYLATIAAEVDVQGACAVAEPGREDALLQVMHAWAYVGMLKMGLMSAVLMENEGHEEKRAVMRTRAPLLLQRGFLLTAQQCLQRARVEEAMQDDLIRRGLFFVTEELWGSAPPSA